MLVDLLDAPAHLNGAATKLHLHFQCLFHRLATLPIRTQMTKVNL
jgi:hypothetical protein